MTKRIINTPCCGDSRFKQWSKTLTGVDRSKKDGYAFQGQFIRSTQELEVGSFILCWGMEGSRKNSSPCVEVYRVVDDPDFEVEEVYRKSSLPDHWALAVRDEIADLLEWAATPATEIDLRALSVGFDLRVHPEMITYLPAGKRLLVHAEVGEFEGLAETVAEGLKAHGYPVEVSTEKCGVEFLAPECAKMAAVTEKSRAIGSFLEWLPSQGVILAIHEPGEGLVPCHTSIETLLAGYFEIDLQKVEAEKRAILDNLQAEEARNG